jgi:DNA adenine methylase
MGRLEPCSEKNAYLQPDSAAPHNEETAYDHVSLQQDGPCDVCLSMFFLWGLLVPEMCKAAFQRGRGLMNIKSIAPWYGGKRKLAPRIVEIIGEHKTYWEPFCGSMAVLMAKPPCEMETVNDLHGDLINLARVIQDKEKAYELYEKLSRTLYAEEMFEDSKERWTSVPGDPDGWLSLERAYDFFVASWMGLNGVSGTERYNYQFALRWCRGGGQGARRWQNVVKSMPAWHKRLQNVVILHRDAFEILANIKDDVDTVIYCDPPYFDKSDKYVHDFKPEQHVQLAESLKRFCNTRVYVSYYDDQKLDVLYPDYKKVSFSESAQSMRNATRVPKKKPRKIIKNDIQGGLFNDDNI